MNRIRDWLKSVVKQRWAYYFIVPGFIIFLIFNIIPTLQTLQLSFFKYNLVKREFAGLANYVALMEDGAFRASVRNTVQYALIITPVSVVLSLLVAVAIFPMKNWMQSIFRGAFFLPNVVGGVIVSAIWLWIYHPLYGFLNYVLSLFGSGPVYWLAETFTVIPATSFVVLTWTCGTLIIIYVAGLASIPATLYEAAKIDGASALRTFFRITLPLLRPITAFVVTTQLIFTFQIWEVIYLLTDGGPFNSSTTLVFDIYKRAFVKGDYGGASAEGAILIAIISLFSLVSLYLLREKTGKSH